MSNALTSFGTRMEPYVYALLRIVSGLMFTFHGVQKIFGWHSSHPIERFSQAWIGGAIELVGGIMIALGWFTRPVAFICSGMMAVAYVQFHWKFQTANAMWIPTLNQGEMALLYSGLFLLFAARGAVALSVDKA